MNTYFFCLDTWRCSIILDAFFILWKPGGARGHSCWFISMLSLRWARTWSCPTISPVQVLLISSWHFWAFIQQYQHTPQMLLIYFNLLKRKTLKPTLLWELEYTLVTRMEGLTAWLPGRFNIFPFQALNVHWVNHLAPKCHVQWEVSLLITQWALPSVLYFAWCDFSQSVLMYN